MWLTAGAFEILLLSAITYSGSCLRPHRKIPKTILCKRIHQLVVCWINNARNSLPGLAAHGRVGHRQKWEMNDAGSQAGEISIETEG